MVSDDTVARFAALFQGYEHAYGTYVTKGTVEPGEKIPGVAKTLRGAPSLALYKSHLDGTGSGLGIIMLREDDTVKFGAIDYDKRDMKHELALAKISQLKLPLVLCRSKSGGGHFYCFCAEPVPAILLRERLDEWKALLGMSANTEVFPKQSSRFSPDDIGSWINIPYFAADTTNRYAVLPQYPQATLEQFLTYAESHLATPEMFKKSWVDEAAEDSLFKGGPPCLLMLEAQGGFQEGTRNNGMAAAIVYLKKADPEHWKDRVDAVNAKMAKLPSSEVQEIVKSHARKAYNYQCKLAPISGFCQRRKCLKQEFGVGQGEDELTRAEIGGITRYDPGHGAEPYWVMEINGRRVRVSNAEFLSKSRMNQASLAQANVVVVMGPQHKWDARINKLVQNCEVVPLPDDASSIGQLLHHVEEFCLNQVMATTREGVLNGTPFREDGRVYFRSADLFRYLRARKVEFPSEQAVYIQLKEIGAGKDFWHLANKSVNVWSVPAPVEATGEAPPVTFAKKESF
jgi:hypothetical protein